MAQTFDMEAFTSRSTDKPFGETTLSLILDCLPALSPSGPWIAGGALRRTLQGQEPDSDFDLFFRDKEQLDAFAAQLDAFNMNKVRETEHHLHFRGVLGGKGPQRDVQLIKFKFYTDAADVIDSFDYTICQFAFDGKSLTCGDFALWDLGRKRLAVHKITFPVSSARRLLKYAQQGYVACAGCLNALVVATANNPELRTDIEYVD